MGAHPDDYEKVLPPNSYIHIDNFASPKEVADYMRKVASNRTLYNSYFRWKSTGEFVNTRFWCRVCSMVHGAHQSHVHTWYSDINKWWSGPSICLHNGGRNGWATWRMTERNISYLPTTYDAYTLSNGKAIPFQSTNAT